MNSKPIPFAKVVGESHNGVDMPRDQVSALLSMYRQNRYLAVHAIRSDKTRAYVVTRQRSFVAIFVIY